MLNIYTNVFKQKSILTPENGQRLYISPEQLKRARRRAITTNQSKARLNKAWKELDKDAQSQTP